MNTTSSSSFDALVAYGWSDRVAALYHSHAASHISSPARVTRVERSACTIIDRCGVERLVPMTAPVAVGDWVVTGADRLEALLACWSSSSARTPTVPKRRCLQPTWTWSW